MKQYTITCDDCGLSEGINLATADLHEKGIATAASIVTNFPAAAHAFQLFARYPKLELGVHLNLTDGFPLTRLSVSAPLTRANGHFALRQVLFTRALLPSASFLRMAEAEMRAQIEVFAKAGLQPQHITTHLHFHAVPSLRKIVLRLAGEYRIPWVRVHTLSAGVVPQNPFYSRRALSPSARGMYGHDHLIDVKSWVGRQPAALLSVLAKLQGAVEFVVHPCTPLDETYPSNVRYLPYERFIEMRYLESIYPFLEPQ
jgi:predicted glycoside hydrolase/deacetylase ChbG (UPF0249 family)